MWKGNQSNYEEIANYITENGSRLVKFETILKKHHNRQYIIYKKRFIEKCTYAEIEEQTDIPTQRLAEEIKSIVLAIQVYIEGVA